MPRRKTLPGTCHYCGKQITRQGITRHLAACAERQAAVAEADARGGTPVRLHHLRVQDGWSDDYWLDLEMPGARSLQDLDRYLRAIWLECCGHMSRFSVGGWRGDEHAESHPHDDYGELVPLVNSPRAGMCGYAGPAEPPY